MSSTADKPKKKNILYLNLAFIICCGAILLFLLRAPEESTAKLPVDDDHKSFHTMKKKAAEKHCGECHVEDGEYPLPEEHPPKFRCLFCHKQVK
ncbi:MAG: hypothetical protein ABFS19_11025 [Thermodesulfobacteriota bacterium]